MVILHCVQVNPCLEWNQIHVVLYHKIGSHFLTLAKENLRDIIILSRKKQFMWSTQITVAFNEHWFNKTWKINTFSAFRTTSADHFLSVHSQIISMLFNTFLMKDHTYCNDIFFPFQPVGNALLCTIEKHLEDDFTQEVHSAWRTFFAVMSYSFAQGLDEDNGKDGWCDNSCFGF